jgi:CubicO group peptidase (beta-lactamase class C family)
MAILETPPLPPRAQARLQKLERAHPEAKTRALILDGSGEPLLVHGDVGLPVVLSGVTKLFTLSMILREFERGAMTPDTLVVDLVPAETIEGLCVLGGVDRSETLTVEHLVSHRSGIVDYYQPGAKKALSLAHQSEQRDRAWSDAQGLEIARHYPAHFAPGARNRARFSSTNYLLLGMILAQSTGMTFEQLINLRVTQPLDLKNTTVFTHAKFDTYFSLAPVYFQGKPLRVPRTLASFGAVGSIVSTARDMTVFLRAFASGELFGTSWLPYLTQSLHRTASGIVMGNGVMVSARNPAGDHYIGHSGSSGAVALIDQKNNTVGFLTTNVIGPKKDPVSDLAHLMTAVAF